MEDLNANDLDAGREDHRRHRPLDGHHRPGLSPAGAPPRIRRHRPIDPRSSWEGRARPAATTAPQQHYRRSAIMKRSKGYRRGGEHRPRHGLQPRSRPSSSPRAPPRPSSTPPSRSRCGSGVDPRKADQMVRCTVILPHGTGKTARVLVFATGDRPRPPAPRAPTTSAADELIDKIAAGFLDFDAAVATPGPDGQGRPPRPGARPARPDAEPEDRHRHHGRGQGRVRHQGRQDRVPRRQARRTCTWSSARRPSPTSSWSRTTRPRSTRSCGPSPSSAKGKYLKKVTFTTTMGPGIPVDPNRTRNLLEVDA